MMFGRLGAIVPGYSVGTVITQNAGNLLIPPAAPPPPVTSTPFTLDSTSSVVLAIGLGVLGFLGYRWYQNRPAAKGK